jgi:dGTPase
MDSLTERLSAANSLLAPYAVPLNGTLGRVQPERDDETRFPFQRDRDRIIHTQSFRRLQGKTQVFVAGEGDHYRTRLTHTMEVAQLSRDIARTLGLNEDLAESIALAHDLGHPPFAHMGEEALDAWMRKHGSHFEHNEQSLRTVTVLEDLNLNREILEGLQKHRKDGEHPRSPSLEAQLVNIADEIAYSAHDYDDGLRAGLFAPGENEQLFGDDSVIHQLVHDLYKTTEENLKRLGINTLDDVYAATEPLVKFSDTMRNSLRQLQHFLNERMYSHPRVLEASRQGQQIITRVCDKLAAAPTEKVLALQKRTGSSLTEAVKDYVAGMTDAFAKAML